MDKKRGSWPSLLMLESLMAVPLFWNGLFILKLSKYNIHNI